MTIKEVCEKYDITADTLRYYERVGVIPTVTRTAGGIRSLISAGSRMQYVFEMPECRWKCLSSM